MQKTIVELPNGLNVEIEVNRYRAKIVYSPKVRGDIVIPKFVDYESKKYLIISIGQDSFRSNQLINSLSFAAETRVRNIDAGIFSESSVSRFLIPASLETLNEMWCCFSNKLIQIEVSPDNQHFIYKYDKFLFNRSNDILIFSRRDISGNIIIPLCVKQIAPNAFSQCKKIDSLSFESSYSSALQSIDKYAFSGCEKLISIQPLPLSVNYLGYMCFFSCIFNSLEILGTNVFIDDECFNGCCLLNCISFPNSKSINIGINAFAKVNNDISLFFQNNTEIKIQYIH